MENAASLMQTPAYGIFSFIRTIVTGSLGPALGFVLLCEHGSRGRYIANTVLRTLLGPATMLMTLDLAVNAAGGDWVIAALDCVFLAFLPLYFRLAGDEDNWWNGRMGKIREAVSSWPTITTVAGSR